MIFGEAREQTGGLNKSCSYSYDMINMIPWYRMVGMKCLISLLFWCYLVLRYWPIVFVAYFLSLLHFTGFQYGGNIITSFFLSATRSLFKDSYWKKGKSAGHAKNYGFVLNRISRGYWFSGWWFGTCFIHPYIGISLKDGILAVLAWWYVAGRSRPDFFGACHRVTFRYEPEMYFGRWENHSYFPSPSDGEKTVGEGLGHRIVRCSRWGTWATDKPPTESIAPHLFPVIPFGLLYNLATET